MASYNKTLQLLASKLGLSEEERVLSKAAEFERLLQTKTIAGSNLSDTSKLVICLDLAAGIFGVDLDVKTAIKYSGLKPISYTSNRKTVENLLELNSTSLTVPQLCVTLQCTGIQELAEKILEEYRKCAKMELDLSLPQYVCMAVYQAARINKVKVSKVKINEKCRLKPAQWAKLEVDWAKFVNEKFAIAPKKRGRPPKATVINDENQEMEIDTKDDAPTETEAEPYEDWKRRMLETAYKELKELQERGNEKISPQKTTQKERGTPIKERGTPLKENGTLRKQLRSTPQKEDGTPEKESGNTLKERRISLKERGTPLKERGTSQKELRGILQKEMRSTPQKEEKERGNSLKGSGTPLKERGISQKELRSTPHKEEKERGNSLKQRGTPIKERCNSQRELRSTPQKEGDASQKDFCSVLYDVSPRKSPRKTPQKYSPYKAPTKGNGVRLLFPNYV